MPRHFEIALPSAENNNRLKTAEVLMPAQLPEAGFQSYEEFKNNAPDEKADFLADTSVNPALTYDRFKDLSRMDAGILRLYGAIEYVRSIEQDSEKADIIASSLEFRAAEMEYVKLLARLDFAVNEGGSEEEVAERAEEARLVGEQLYGTPEQGIRDAAFAEVWRQLDGKDLSPSAKKLYDELRNGFSWGDRQIPGLPRPEAAETLPDFNDPSLAWAGEVVLEKNADITALIDEFWEAKVAEHGEGYAASPEDIVEAFENVLQLMDPEGNSGVRIILDPEATALSWETPLMAVKVGGKRDPIEQKEELLQKVLHELKVHGGRAINGLKTGLPVLGTGLYTDTVRPDYLTFEEGFATTIEEAISEKQPVWNGTSMGYYMNIALAANGADFRDVFETSWRYRLLLNLKDGQEVTDELIEKERRLAYVPATRIFRGTPANIKQTHPNVAPLTFNKDLAYMSGRILAMKHIKELYETRDEAGLMRLFDAKYDPTIPEQAEIVAKYVP